jgi:demethylmenaquinone methyltransferase/2-methoxy-6-polyprenyl-1,4-benzoquinol methylase
MFQSLENQDKSGFVRDMFGDIAADYDKMNTIMTLGRHKSVKNKAVSKLPPLNKIKILDLCTGTGDIAQIFARKYPDSEIFAVDFCEDMLEIAREKTSKLTNIKYICSDVLNLPFNNNAFDLVFISFGLRNLNSVEAGIQEMKRVVKKGGCVSNLDLGVPDYLIRPIFKQYFFNVVPFIGKIVHGNSFPYQYLPDSSKTFPSQYELVKIFQDNGFSEVKNYNYLFGTIAQQIAKL